MQTFLAVSKNLINRAIDMVLPPRCLVTGEEVVRQGSLSPKAWSAIDFIAAPLCMCCGIPFDFSVDDVENLGSVGEIEAGQGVHCASCLADPPPFQTARAAVRYNQSSRDLILSFKHADKTHFVKAFTPWMRRAGADMLAQADIIVPVPLHTSRLRFRRYNQAALIAQEIGRACACSVELNTLRRIKATKSQGHMTIQEREENVRKAFSVVDVDAVAGKTIVLVDDVYTTGATVNACSKALLKAGAHCVHVLTLSRVVRPGFD